MRKILLGLQFRKGVANEVFLYITALLIFILVILFGYSSIAQFIDKGERVAFLTFKTTLERSIQDIARSYGSVLVFNAQNHLSVPATYSHVCFVNMDASPPSPCSSSLNPIICDAWQTAFTAGGWEMADANIFTEPIGILPIKSYRIRVDSNGNHAEDTSDVGYLCVDTSSHRLDIRLEGKGDHALVSLV